MATRPRPLGPVSDWTRTGGARLQSGGGHASARRIPALAYGLGGVLVVLLLAASAAGLLVPGLYRDPPVTAKQSLGVNLVDLIATSPVLVASMALVAHGSPRARLVWLGTLGYILYNYLIFTFAIAFNPFFLIYVAIVALSAWSLLALMTHLDVEGLHRLFSPAAPIRAVGLFLLAVAALFFLAWMRDIIPASLGNTTPRGIVEAKMPTNPVYVLDLAFLLPLLVLTAIMLRRRRPWGYALAGMLLVQTTLLAVSIVFSALFQYAAGQSASLEIVPLFGAVAVVSLVLTVLYLRCLHRPPIAEKGGGRGT